MTIKEVETRSGVARANIRYYEAEGLLMPQRLKNGYRTYSEADLALLEKIKLLRRLGVPIEELRSLRQGQTDLPAVLDRRLRELAGEEAVLLRVEQVCGSLRAESPSFETLEPEKYLEALDAPALPETAQTPPLPAADALPVVTNLWRRLAARVLDWFFLLMLTYTAAALFGWNIARVAGALPGLGLAALLLLLEPLLLHLFAATPGKALLGMKITRRDGGKLSYQEGINRHLRMLWEALGLWLPIWSWIQIYKCCKRWSEEEPQPWDEGLAYTAQPFRPWRHLGGTALACLAVLTAAEAVNSASQLPPHRGDLTVAEFAENYNRQAAYIFDSTKFYLDETGQWQEEPDPPGVFSVGFTEDWAEERLQYTLEEGVVKAVTLEYAVENAESWMSLPSVTVTTAATAFVWAQRGTPFWTTGRKPLIKALEEADWNHDFTLRHSGAVIDWHVESRNFDLSKSTGMAFPREGGENRLAIRCKISLEK